VKAVPAAGGGWAVEARVCHGGHVWLSAAGRVAEDELPAVAGRPAVGTWQAEWDSAAQHPIGTHPGQQLHGQIA